MFWMCERFCFNPRPYERGDCAELLLPPDLKVFQSTPLREGRRFNLSPKVSQSSSFNPRPYERGDIDYKPKIQGFEDVSIHAPTRGATPCSRLSIPMRNCVSIHAPTRGATEAYLAIYAAVDVSIHAPTRGATRGQARWLTKRRVSIHAPTRGATPDQLGDPDAPPVSIHAPTRGATYRNFGMMATQLFQSTPLREGRPMRIRNKEKVITSFNPRPYERGDGIFVCIF